LPLAVYALDFGKVGGFQCSLCISYGFCWHLDEGQMSLFQYKVSVGDMGKAHCKLVVATVV